MQFLDVAGEHPDSPYEAVLRMGMTGSWQFLDQAEHAKSPARDSPLEDLIPQHTHLQFHASDGSRMLLVDSRRFARWQAGSWSEERSPDPVDEWEALCESMRKSFTNPRRLQSFKKLPIGEALLRQEHFNGIGNYLRAEILFRANIHPKETVWNAMRVVDPLPIDGASVELAPPAEFDFQESLILKLAREVTMEALQLPHYNKTGWYRCYGLETSLSFQDTQKRTMWHHPNQRFVVPQAQVDNERVTTPEDADADSSGAEGDPPARRSIRNKRTSSEAELASTSPKRAKNE